MRDRLRLLERRDIDELIVLDIAATPSNRGPRFEQIAELCEGMFCPVTVGGGVRNVSDIRRLLAEGADKVAINTAAIERPSLIEEAANKFGNQAIVVAVDDRTGECATRCGSQKTGWLSAAWAKEAESRGAGEILLTSIDRDGTMQGYDLELIRSVSSAVSIPVIAAGGCGTYQHMVEAMEAGAHAVASGAMFQFTDSTPKGAARHLAEHGIAARI